MNTTKAPRKTKKTTEILADFKLACLSREASLLGRKEVFMGKAKFGIFGDGKELAQIAMAKSFKNGDFRSGYYRDQTFMFAINQLTLQEYFAQLYAHTDVEADPSSAGRLMNGHFSTRLLDEEGNWKNLTEEKHSSADISPTAGQMPRLLGLAYASKLYRQNAGLKELKQFSINGNEVAFGTIGNASTSEGMFYEAVNAAGVLQVPMLISIWDDEYGISVPKEYHTTKGNISAVLEGFRRDEHHAGFEIYRVNGWDYRALIDTYQEASELSRKNHVPTMVHVQQMTQPQGHSTSGSHERYKSPERLQWEAEHDCIKMFRSWIIEEGVAESDELDELASLAKKEAKEAKDAAWQAFNKSIEEEHNAALQCLANAINEFREIRGLEEIRDTLDKTVNPIRLDSYKAIKKGLRLLSKKSGESRAAMITWLKRAENKNYDRFNSYLYSQSSESALEVDEIPAFYSEQSQMVDGREVLQACFNAALQRDPRVLAFGEDVGKIGDVNQAFAGLQEKYGESRVTDTGIRECTIIGQGIGAALRGLRPIAEIQYLDYLLYAIQILSDDLATLQYRTKGGQKAPLIIRTRGHRLEGVWHSGSPMGMILNSIRGIYVLVPRNMTQAAGFYNTMLKSDDAAIIIECLNGYRLKEKTPDNISEFTVPLGKVETLREGKDVTIVTYGSMCRVVMDAADQLNEMGISCEIIDTQTLLPFDLNHDILKSVKKTSRVVFADEDVPGGASAFMMQKVLEEQGAYQYLDSKPITITGKEHRPAYASDGDYFSKPNPEEIFDKVYALMSEANPDKYPDIY
ncbi:thiamine pyrophosphate-dependent enzyme [Fulvivirga sp.]|uniref:alpha-ketoacid dehydrogenase subunit alpha/beta n=1 Tax=Fulvivirga sp. TaxID=1931237 RepID=UPI0032EB5415